jgi:hypothetical protein
MRRLILLALALGVVALVTVYWWPSREPMYYGYRLSYWLQGYSRGPSSPPVSRYEADAAVDAAGTNAIPLLLRLLAAKDPAWLRKLESLRRSPYFPHFIYLSALHFNARAIAGFDRLGPAAQRTVPVSAWISICEQKPSYMSQHFATKALGDLGADGHSAIPFLLKVADDTNTDPVLRVDAFDALARVGVAPEIFAPVMARAAHDRNSLVRDEALDYLWPLGEDARSKAAGLMELLISPDARAQSKQVDAQALGKTDGGRTVNMPGQKVDGKK